MESIIQEFVNPCDRYARDSRIACATLDEEIEV